MASLCKSDLRFEFNFKKAYRLVQKIMIGFTVFMTAVKAEILQTIFYL
jgi:hypothetical protein